jgi:hypothetical protein
LCPVGVVIPDLDDQQVLDPQELARGDVQRAPLALAVACCTATTY